MHLIGITGGIATGKSTVTKRLREKGYTVLDGDEIARQVVSAGTPALRRIQQEFGPRVMTPAGDLDRPALAQIVFHDEEKRKLLNSIVHPEVYGQILRQSLKCLLLRKSLIFMDMPLLFESGAMLKYLSKIIVVSCRPEQQLQRLMARNDMTEEEASSRISSQMSLEEKCRRAHFVIDNSGDIAATHQQVDQIDAVLCEKYRTWVSRYLLLDALVLMIGAGFGCLLMWLMSIVSQEM
jgi:dephospho-CoA kinase